MKTYWTDERIERLKALWVDGYSAAQIAKILGTVTRNSVIGKVHRLGLSRHHQKTIGSRHSPRSRRAPEPVVFESTACWTDERIERLKALWVDDGVAFMDLERRHCRWPVDAQFCGADAVESKPYCGRHLRMAYK